MKTTAERSSQSDITINPIFCQHLSVYEFAQQFVKDRVVLDVGCGEGYGTALLAKQTKKIVGIDYSKATIKRATENYTYFNLEFICEDINHLKLEDESFEVICAFQFIEHLSRQEVFLSKVKNLLRPEGLFLLSTPNKKALIIQHPYHFREYDKEELALLFKRYFFKVDLFGLQFSPKVAAFREKRKTESQKILQLDPLKLYRFLPRFIRQRLFDLIAAKMSKKIYLENRDLSQAITTNDYWVSKENIDSAIDLICVCQK